MLNHFTSSLLISALFISAIYAQDRAKKPNYSPELEGAKIEVYKTVGDVKLNMYIFTPEDHKPSDRRAAAVFFFGGGWRAGRPSNLNSIASISHRAAWWR